MDVNPAWIEVLTGGGFAILAALMIARWAAARVEGAEARALEREKLLNERVQSMEVEMRTELKALVREGTAAVVVGNQVAKECTQALRECTAVLSKLKQSAPSIQLPMGATDFHLEASGSGILEKGRTEKGKA